jgi:hypothetical protein
MDDLLVRLGVLLRVGVPFVLFMASVYLALHVVCARLVRRADSPLLWFFGVVTGPLTRPVRALLPPRTRESRVRFAALGLYVLLWIATRVLLAPGRGSLQP